MLLQVDPTHVQASCELAAAQGPYESLGLGLKFKV